MNKRHVSSHRIVCWRFTQRCNRRCEFCLAASGPHLRHTVRQPELELLRLRELNVEKVSYAGGEALLHPRLRESVELGAKLGFRQILTTNGDVLGKTSLPWLSKLEYVKVSFYGRGRTHDAVMGSGHYEMLLRVIEQHQESSVVFGANYMLTRGSASEVGEFLCDVAKVGVRQVLLLTYVPTGDPKIDSNYQLGDSLEAERLVAKEVARRCKDLTECFAGGVKIHVNASSHFFIVLDEDGILTLPRSAMPSFRMGDLFDKKLRLPEGKLLGAPQALEAIWSCREVTDAIMVL